MSKMRFYHLASDGKDKILRQYETHLRQVEDKFESWEKTLGFPYEEMLKYCSIIVGKNSIIVFWVEDIKKEKVVNLWAYLHRSYVGGKVDYIHNMVDEVRNDHERRNRLATLLKLIRGVYGPINLGDGESVWNRNQVWEMLGFNGQTFERVSYNDMSKVLMDRKIPQKDMEAIYRVLVHGPLTIVVYLYKSYTTYNNGVGHGVGKKNTYSTSSNSIERCHLFVGNESIDWANNNAAGESGSDVSVYKEAKCLPIFQKIGARVHMNNFATYRFCNMPPDEQFVPMFERE